MIADLTWYKRDDSWSARVGFHPLKCLNRLTSWYEEGENVPVLLPALAAYMGHVGMNGMERYLSLTPAHYRRQVTGLSAPLMKKRTH